MLLLYQWFTTSTQQWEKLYDIPGIAFMTYMERVKRRSGSCIHSYITERMKVSVTLALLPVGDPYLSADVQQQSTLGRNQRVHWRTGVQISGFESNLGDVL